MKRKLVVILLILAAVIIFLLAGKKYFLAADDPEQDLKTALDAVAARDAETAGEYIDYDSFYPQGEDAGVYEEIMKHFSYKIENVEVKGNKAKADITVSNRDMDKVYRNFVIESCQKVIDNASSDGEKKSAKEMEALVKKLFYKHIAEDSVSARTGKIQADLRRSGRKWKITIAQAYYDDIYGGYFTAQEKADKLLGQVDSGSLDELEKEYGSSIRDSKTDMKRAVHFIVDSLWNKCLRDIVSFENAGTDAQGNDYDLDGGLKKLKKLRGEKKKYDTLVEGLDDKEYKDFKASWKKMSTALDKIAGTVQKKKENADIKTKDFEKCLDRLVALAY